MLEVGGSIAAGCARGRRVWCGLRRGDAELGVGNIQLPASNTQHRGVPSSTLAASRAALLAGGPLEIGDIAANHSMGRIRLNPARFKLLWRKQTLILCCDEMIQSFAAGTQSIAAKFGIVGEVIAPKALGDVRCDGPC